MLVVLGVTDQVADVVQQRRRLEHIPAGGRQREALLDAVEDLQGQRGDVLAVPLVRAGTCGRSGGPTPSGRPAAGAAPTRERPGSSEIMCSRRPSRIPRSLTRICWASQPLAPDERSRWLRPR